MIVKLAGGVARSIELGMMPLALRVSVTVSAAVPTRLKELLPTCCQTWPRPGPPTARAGSA